jgi:cytochrome P450
MTTNMLDQAMTAIFNAHGIVRDLSSTLASDTLSLSGIPASIVAYSAITIAYILALFVVLYVRYLLLQAWNFICGRPPLETGLLPFVGAVPGFARYMPINFLRMCHEKHGDTFTLFVAGRSMTFMFDPEHFNIFFNNTKNNAVSFSAATLPFLDRGFGVVPSQYFHHHKNVLSQVRRHLAPKSINDTFCEGIRDQFTEHLADKWPAESGELKLMEAVRHAVFWGSITMFFGKESHEFPFLEHDLHEFNDLFEIALSAVPLFMLPGFTRSKESIRATLLKLVREKQNPNEPGYLAGTVDKALDASDCARDAAFDKSKPGWLLSTMWAAEANSIPCTFWVLAYLIMNPQCMQKLRKELVEAMQECDGQLDFSRMQRLKYLNACVNETIRMRAPGTIVRKATKPIKVGKYTVPKGNMICLSPLLVHHNPQVYKNPYDFIPERWDTESKWHTPQMDERFKFIAFGDGAYRCPGKHFATMEIGMFAALAVLNFDMEFSKGEKAPEPRMDRLVGIQEPWNDVGITVTRREQPW